VSKEAVTDEKPKSSSPDRPFTDDELSKVWSKLAESRKDQAATYHLLSRGYFREGNTLVIHLNNPVEEPLLQSMKTDLVSYLRESLGNNSLQLRSLMFEVAANKMIFGLDPDF